VTAPHGVSAYAGAVADENTIGELARAFLAAAFSTLREQHVIPTPVFHPSVRVGRDFFGPDIARGQAYGALEAALMDDYPDRFADPLDSDLPEFPNTYIFSLLETAVSRCGRAGDFSIDSEPVDRSIQEMVGLLRPGDDEVICCRAVSHVTTDGEPMEIGGIEVVPECNQDRDELWRIITERIPATPLALNREAPFVFSHPHAVLVARRRSERQSPYDTGAAAALAVDRMLLSIRLLTGTTAQSLIEVRGTDGLLTRMHPELREYPHEGMARSIRRTADLRAEDAAGLEGITEMIAKTDIKRDGMVATPFDVALGKFQGSYTEGREFARLVELATALEATLAGEGENAGLTLRLRNRAAALLACERDPAPAIFGDIGALYEIRSSIVHGGQLKAKGLTKLASRISTVKLSEKELDRISFAHLLDRMRDLVRRAILARICLAAGEDASWPISGGDQNVDAELAADTTRARWREEWRAHLRERGAGAAADPAPAAVDSLLPPG
jgi:hypothetical protein